MVKSQRLIEIYEKYGAHNYHPLPVVLARGRGVHVWDVEGKKYLDFLSSYGALNFGHQHPTLVKALKRQISKLALCSRAFYNEELALLTKELSKLCNMDSVLAMNSGAEAVEAAIKLVRKWGYECKRVAPDEANILVMKNNFHGRTLTVISFSSEVLYKKNFGPLTPGFTSVSFGDAQAVKDAIGPNTVAILLEPIQAEAGILIPPKGYLSELRALCDQRNILLVLDEIQTGFGRTGRDFCFQWESIVPDVLILGKALGGGLLPVSAVVAKKQVMDVLIPGTHGSTFGGNPLSSAVGRSAIKILKEQRLAERAKNLGRLALEFLNAKPLPGVRNIRGLGCLIGIELDKGVGGARRYCEMLAQEGILCKETHKHVIRIAPPLTILDSQFINGLEKICKVIGTLGKK